MLNVQSPKPLSIKEVIHGPENLYNLSCLGVGVKVHKPEWIEQND
ncbi:17257_t:CDS:2 [Entrophospora sp. SA101]|nr:17257_t:CDS:2 [Entrophospora sp. SA101]